MGNHPAQDLDAVVTEHDANSSENSGAPSLIVAGGGLDNVEVQGQTIDRRAAVGPAGNFADSAVIATQFLAALADTETLSLRHRIEESDDGSSFDAPEELEAPTVVALASGAENKRGVREVKLTLRGRKQFYRINVTPDLSRGATDTASFATVVTQGGYDQHPV